jgi:cytochrome c-type protein NapB
MADPLPRPPSRIVTVICLLVIALAVAGVVVGFAPATPGWVARTSHPAEVEPGDVLPAVRWSEMDGKARGPNRHFHSDVATLQSHLPAVTDPVVNTSEDKAIALAVRASRRAYAGAPPTIPHPVDANQTSSCLACHGSGVQVDGRLAPKISHVHLTNCTQCHAQAATPGMGPEFPVANTFVGLASPSASTRAWPGAPPTMPHSTHMREDCTSCHGLTGRAGMRTTHPWRVNCLQCHATSAALDGRDQTHALALPPGPPVAPVAGSPTP